MVNLMHTPFRWASRTASDLFSIEGLLGVLCVLLAFDYANLLLMRQIQTKARWLKRFICHLVSFFQQ